MISDKRLEEMQKLYNIGYTNSKRINPLATSSKWKCQKITKRSKPKFTSKDIDTGAPTQANYQFQYSCAAIIAINMYGGKFKFKELFCEIFEDVLGVKNNNHIVGIQIKYRDSKYGAFPITNEDIIQTIKKFAQLDEQFSGKCDEFIFMSNMQIVFGNKKPLEELTNICKNDPKEIPKDIKKFIDEITNKAKVDESKIIKVLSKMSYQSVPDRDHIKDTIVNKHLLTLSECKGLHPSQLNDIVDSLIELIEKKSTLLQDSLILYSAFLENVDKDNQIVNTKRIVSEDVKAVIKQGASYVYLESKPPEKITIGSYGLIDTKMNLGRINQSEIENVKRLTKLTEEFFIEKYHEEEEAESLLKIYQDVQTRLLTIQAECETVARNQGNPFGSKKLELIEKRLQNEVENKPEKFHYVQYEHLKGVLGILMTKCLVPFSEKPQGGWL